MGAIVFAHSISMISVWIISLLIMLQTYFFFPLPCIFFDLPMRLLIERITAVNTAPAIAAFISLLIVLNILSYLWLICFFILICYLSSSSRLIFASCLSNILSDESFWSYTFITLQIVIASNVNLLLLELLYPDILSAFNTHLQCRWFTKVSCTTVCTYTHIL